jgi:hypothetical protein
MNVDRESQGVCADLGNRGADRRLTVEAEKRALAVLADSPALRRIGAAAPLLAVVIERCGDGDGCRLKYAEVANELGASATTVKTWSEALEKLRYYARTPCGPAGVGIRLCLERWPSQGARTALTNAGEQIAAVLDAVRLTVDRALGSAAADVRHTLGEVA